MPQIFVLPEHIASQIAAGEVVERPASVVKELVENSIDAGATKIVIDIAEACRYIRVADNGCGMEVADASLAFQRHATSKLTSADDLWNLNTLGFRGEALPSIASVSRLTCLTRTNHNDIGTKVTSMDGTATLTETGCAKGTVIEVEDLFYNVPARLSFLKKAGTEFAHILDIVQSLAICYPSIAFELNLDGNLKLKTLGTNELDAAITQSNFLSEKENFIELSGKDGVLGLEIEGRLGNPKSFRGDRKGIMTLVNKRPVRCSLAYKALDYAYADLIPRGRYPLAVLHLKVAPNELDINIHPTKKEIRYSRGNDVYLFMQRQIMQALRNGQRSVVAYSTTTEKAGVWQSNSAVDMSATEQLNFEPPLEKTPASGFASNSNSSKQQPVFKQSSAREQSKQLSLQEADDTIYFNNTASSTSTVSAGVMPNMDIASLIEQEPFKNLLEPVERTEVQRFRTDKPVGLPLAWRLAGYFANTYILVETKDGLSIIEQHIAHERYMYEKLLARDAQAEGQNILISLPLKLSAEQKTVLEENIEELKIQGFEFDIDGENISCSQVPVELAHKDYATIIQNMMQELAESSNINPKLDIIKSIACQSAIKNGMPLANEQIIELLNNWHNTPRNDTCPHGRPIQLNFSHEKLFQMFHPA